MDQNREPTSVRIYLVEDENFSRKLMGMYLKGLEAEIHLLATGQECLNLVAQQHPDLILMDCQMSGMDGFETVSRLRATGYRGIVLALTANSDQATLQRCRTAGMNGHIPKPVDAATLRTRIEAALNSTATEQIAPSISFTADNDPLARLRGTATSGQHNAHMWRLVESFIQAGDESIQQLRTALTNNSKEEVVAAAHQLRGAAGAFGASQFAKAAGILEDTLASQSLEQSTHFIEQLLELWGPLRTYLETAAPTASS